MQINRHNYEEFFLLYVDNELSAADRKAVELFVQENADLEEELNMLQQTVFNADTVVFDNKTSLLKKEITALQENLLLYVDDELNAADKLNTEKLLEANVTANKELALLRQTKLQPDTAIVFANKKILYRKKSGRVIDLPWRRIAVAAILLGFGTWATVTFIKTDKTGIGKDATADRIKTNTPTQIEKTVTPVLPTQQQDAATTNTATANAKDAVKQAAQKNNTPAVANKAKQNIPEQRDDNNDVAQKEIKKPNNNLPKSYLENINNDQRNKNIDASVTLTNTTIETIKPAVKIPFVEPQSDKSKDATVNGYALNANYTESDDANNLSQDDNKGKKTKLGGFIRKVKRLVDRNTNVTNGNGVQIAGFDIAIK